MKNFILSVALSLGGAFSFAQVGAVAPDFTQTDLNGTEHNLHTYLNAGKVVVVDMSATWCPPCWSFHQAHYLQDLHDEFGPGGTDQVVIIFYEDDVSTTLADLQGTGPNTQGDWLTGVTYPVINATQALPSQYGAGYPTVSVICPSDKKIKSNLFGMADLAAMRTNIQSVIAECTSGTASIDELATIDLTIAPNPATDNTQVRFNSDAAQAATVNVYGVTGQLITSFNQSVVAGANSIDLDLSSYEAGSYFIQVATDASSSAMVPFVKR